MTNDRSLTRYGKGLEAYIAAAGDALADAIGEGDRIGSHQATRNIVEAANAALARASDGHVLRIETTGNSYQPWIVVKSSRAYCNRVGCWNRAEDSGDCAEHEAQSGARRLAEDAGTVTYRSVGDGP